MAPRGKYIANLLKVRTRNTFRSVREKATYESKLVFLKLFLYSAMQDLDVAMKKSTARWKIVVGHHTMRSVSEHGDTEELLKLLLPVLKVTFQKLLQSIGLNF